MSGSTIREDHLDPPVEERCLKISAYSDKNCRRRSILKMPTDRMTDWQTDRMTEPQTDTSTENKGRYSSGTKNSWNCTNIVQMT